MPNPSLSGCPDVDVLLAFNRRQLPEPRLTTIAEHLKGCVHCRTQLAEVRGDVGRAAKDDTSIHRTTDILPAHSTKIIPADATGDWAAGSSALGQADNLSTQDAGANLSGVTSDAGSNSEDTEPTKPRIFGAYRLLEKLGEGGMGIVYRAHDPRLKRTVALKMIRAGRTSEDDRGRFLAEAEAVARLEHPNIVRIYELGEVDGQPFASLEFVAGGSLDQRVRKTLPDPRAAARLMIPIARAVQSAHELKIVHRDLKPANILLSGTPETALERCIPKVADFGLAKFLDADDGGTRTDAVMGTPSYMAPEQAEGRGADIGPCTDVYALGALLYDLLSGRPPFKGTTVRDTLKMVSEQDPIPLRQLQTRVPRDLETICLKCLQKSPERRYLSAAELADDLQRFLNGEPITARPVSGAEKVWRWCRRKPALAGLTGFSILAAAALLAGAFWFTYAVADEKRKKEVAEERAAKELAEREKVDVERVSAVNLEKVNRYFALSTQARERIVTRETGWVWKAADDIREAASIDSPARNPVELRSALAACLAGTDVRESRVLAPGFNARVLCFHPNGRWVILAEGRTGQGFRELGVLFVDFATGETVKKFSFPSGLAGTLIDPRPDMANSVTVSPNGRWLAVGTRSGAIHRWDLEAEKPTVETWSPEPPAFNKTAECVGLAFSPDSGALYVALLLSGNGAITRWDTKTWKQTARHFTEKTAGGLVIHPRGAVVYCHGSELSARELDPVTLEKKTEFAKDFATGQAISPNGRTLALSRSGRLAFWDTQKREPAFSIREPLRETALREDPTHRIISPDGRLLLGTHEHGRNAFLWDLTTGERVAVWRIEEGYASAAFDPSGRFVVIGGANRTMVYEISGQQEHRTVTPQPYPVRSAGLSPDGRTLAITVAQHPSGNWKALPYLWELDSAKREPLWTHNQFGDSGQRDSISFTPTDSHVAIVCEGEVKIFDRRNMKDPNFTYVFDDLHRGAIGPDGRLWMIADKNVFTLAPSLDKKTLLRWTNPLAKITGLGGMQSLGVGKAYAVAGGIDGSLRVFSTAVPAEGELELASLVNIENRIALGAVAVSPDDSFAVVGCDTGKCAIVSLPAGAILSEWDAHADAVSDALFLAPGLFVTSGKDRILRFWSWNGKQVRELWAFRLLSPATSLGKSATGSRITVTCEGERGVHVWDLAALNRRFREFGLGIDAPGSWAAPRSGPEK